MKPPAASKFLQRGGLGEAHLDLEGRFSNDLIGGPTPVDKNFSD